MTNRRDETVPQGFSHPTAPPQSDEQARQWQEANRQWWEQHPMRYDWKQEIGHEEFSEGFYDEIDRRFLSVAKQFMPWKREPFDQLIPFDTLGSRDVLEIGVGNGSHAQLLARYARSFTGIDLTEYAVRSTQQRLQWRGLKGTVIRMDAEQMDFADNSFDFIWTWGVIHHSSNTRNVLKEMNRVMRPGGEAVTMVYHRNIWGWYVVSGFINGILRGRLFRTGSLHGTAQQTTDGAIARYYTDAEWVDLVKEFFEVEEIRIYGSKPELVPLPGGRLKRAVMAIIPDAFARFLTNRCQMGQFLCSRLKKRSSSP